MYRLTFSLLFFLAFFTLSAQEWVQQYPFSLLSKLEAIAVDPSGTAWAVGDKSGILHSDDFGGMWSILEPPAADPVFRDVLILPGSGGAQALLAGTDLHLTTDNGQTWTSTGFDEIYDFGGLQALDAQTFLAFAKKGMARTEDGGSTWQELPYPGDVSFGNPPHGFFISESEGWMVEFALNSRVFHTTDGGTTWTQAGTQTFTFARGVHFFDDQHGLILDNDFLYESMDGGLSWTAVNPTEFPIPRGLLVASDDFWVVTCGNGSIQYTEDAGGTWLQISPLSYSPSLQAAASLNAEQFWIAGSYSTIVWTDDFANFTEQVPGVKAPFHSIDFLDDQQGLAVSTEGHVVRTFDGGAIWENITPDDFSSNQTPLAQVYIESEDAVWASTYSGGQMYFSSDFGDSWQALGAAGGSDFRFQKTGPQEFFAIEYNGKFYHSTDGAMSWTLMEDLDGIFEDLFFHNPQDGWLAGRDGQLLHTTDGGQTWQTVQPGSDSLEDFGLIRFVDEQTGWAVPRLGGHLYRTEDGGLTWQQHNLSINVLWKDLDFVDDQRLWLCGGVAGFGVVVQSVDGGLNWTTTLADAPQILQALSCPVSEEVAWVAGAAGQIAKWVVCSGDIPVFNDIEGPSAPCLGDTVQYTVDATAVDIFEWEFPSAWFLLGNENTAQVSVIVGEQQGDVIVTGKNTCGDSTEIALALDFSPIPPAPSIAFMDGLLETSTQDAAAYHWYLEGVLTATTSVNTYEPTVSGNWSLSILSPAGCESDLSEEVFVMVTGTSAPEASSPQLSPNPTHGLVTIRHLPKGSKSLLILTDVYGKRILSATPAPAETLEWALPGHLPAGLYILKLQVDEKHYAWRLLLENE